MIIECPYCESKVNGEVVGSHTDPMTDYGEPFKVSLLKCPACMNAILAGQDYVSLGPDIDDWSKATRLWPTPDRLLDWKLPQIVRESLEEAIRCYKARAYIACAVMCGRALEAVCSTHKTKSKNLATGLKELLEKKIIDEKIYKWSEVLREHRNIGAHATTENISKQDAKDLLDFSNAICDYVFPFAGSGLHPEPFSLVGRALPAKIRWAVPTLPGFPGHELRTRTTASHQHPRNRRSHEAREHPCH